MATIESSIHTIGVVGAGAMGAGIAQAALGAGLKVVLHDSAPRALEGAREQIRARLARLVEKRELPPESREWVDSRLSLAREVAALAPAQIVIEAIIESLEPKQALFAALEKCVSDDAVLATNTSSLSVAAIAKPCAKRGRVIGMHFFNPVPLMKLVEIIRAPESTQAAIDLGLALAAKLGKTSVEVRDVPGFLVNLIGRAYPTEALHVHTEGVASVETIDRIMRDAAGFRMGPFELMDLTGIDVNFPASTSIHRGFQFDPRLKTTWVHESLFNAGRFGRKTSRGFYSYAEEGAPARPERAPAAPVQSPEIRSPSVFIAEQHPGFGQLIQKGLRAVDSAASADIVLVSPRGEDAAGASCRLKIPAARTVAIDFLGLNRNFLTLMAPLTGGAAAEHLSQYLSGIGYSTAVIKDSPGFVAPRILAMVANLGCEAAQLGIGSPRDVDVAMRLAQNYPRGPLEWAEALGTREVFDTLTQLQSVTGSDRYRPSLWLRRRALLGASIYELD
jgi:3-hydroxybutyryl-CoA dehydrogenase